MAETTATREEMQKIIVEHTAERYDPNDAFKVELERTSTGKYRILCKASQPTKTAAAEAAISMLRDMEARLGISE